MHRDAIDFDWHMEYNLLGLPDLTCPADPAEPCNSVMLFSNTGSDTNTFGTVIALQWKPVKELRISGNYTQRYSWFVNRAPLDSDVTGDKVGDRYRYEPQHMANLSLHYLSGFGLRLGLSAFVRSSNITARIPDGGLFGEEEVFRNPPDWLLGAYLSYRLSLGDHWLEAGVRTFNALNNPYRDTTAITRFDGELMGAQLMGRRAVLFIRGQY